MFSNTIKALRTALLTFTISLIISLFFNTSLSLWLSLVFLGVIITTGIIFDIIGTAVTAASEMPFHAMASDKVSGSKQAIYLVRHADRVANFCNDVVGDIAGTLGGVLVAAITLNINQYNHLLKEQLLGSIMIALAAALTVGGKAFGKSYAMNRANDIVFFVGKLLALFNLADFNPKKSKKKSKTNSRKVKKAK